MRNQYACSASVSSIHNILITARPQKVYEIYNISNSYCARPSWTLAFQNLKNKSLLSASQFSTFSLLKTHPQHQSYTIYSFLNYYSTNCLNPSAIVLVFDRLIGIILLNFNSLICGRRVFKTIKKVQNEKFISVNILEPNRSLFKIAQIQL